jgi:hypothetical protein
MNARFHLFDLSRDAAGFEAGDDLKTRTDFA